ncbi:MAG: flagellar biosynthetic protein FliO [Rhodocyclaceae bacterium]|jgi:flagellar protein FliO/FliZ|nr:flagellar biosynthetic protein FliO [Rhodocyclaceae bacterium]
MSPRLPLFTFLLLAAPVLRAAEVGAGSTAPDLGTSALQMIFGLLLVLGLLLGTLWLLKRISQPRGNVAGLLRVVAGVAVGSRERVVILELGNSWLVLGVAPGQVSTLAEIPRQEMPAAPAPRDFVGQLAERLRKNA